MRVDIGKFGDLLISRPSGREAFLAFRAYNKPKDENEIIELDFSNVKVLAPSWADEFVTGIRTEFKNKVVLLQSTNTSVIESLKFLDGNY